MTFLSIKQAAAQLAVSGRLLYKLVDEGKIASYRIGSAVRISEEDLESYLASRRLERKGNKKAANGLAAHQSQ